MSFLVISELDMIFHDWLKARLRWPWLDRWTLVSFRSSRLDIVMCVT